MCRRINRLCGLALLLVVVADLAGCGAGGFQPCNESPYETSGPCSVGRHHDNSA